LLSLRSIKTTSMLSSRKNRPFPRQDRSMSRLKARRSRSRWKICSICHRSRCTYTTHTATLTSPTPVPVLARVGLKASRETEPLILHSSLVATGTDHYFVLYSLAEIEPSFSTGQVIVAIMKSGLPNTDGGLIELVNTADAKPARWLHGLTDLNVMSLAPSK
jgi:hypothetical protein